MVPSEIQIPHTTFTETFLSAAEFKLLIGGTVSTLTLVLAVTPELLFGFKLNCTKPTEHISVQLVENEKHNTFCAPIIATWPLKVLN